MIQLTYSTFFETLFQKNIGEKIISSSKQFPFEPGIKNAFLKTKFYLHDILFYKANRNVVYFVEIVLCFNQLRKNLKYTQFSCYTGSMYYHL
jgi:hypothetical protein